MLDAEAQIGQPKTKQGPSQNGRIKNQTHVVFQVFVISETGVAAFAWVQGINILHAGQNNNQYHH